MKQQKFTDYVEYVDHIISNKYTLLTFPVVEIFVFEEDFGFKKISLNEVKRQTKTVFKFENHIWYYWEKKKNQFIEVTTDEKIDKLLKPMYDKYYQEAYSTIVKENE